MRGSREVLGAGNTCYLGLGGGYMKAYRYKIHRVESLRQVHVMYLEDLLFTELRIPQTTPWPDPGKAWFISGWMRKAMPHYCQLGAELGGRTL